MHISLVKFFSDCFTSGINDFLIHLLLNWDKQAKTFPEEENITVMPTAYENQANNLANNFKESSKQEAVIIYTLK